MQTADFLRKICPEEGLICIAIQRSSGAKSWFDHHFYANADQAAQAVANFDAGGATIYYAPATYRTADNRRGENAHAAQALWLDLDCGPEKDYPDQPTALSGLWAFLQEVGLPTPMLVNSGTGVHAYWPTAEPQLPSAWRELAALFKGVCNAYGMAADPARTADIVSVLRPVGSTHRKGSPRPVTLIRDAAATPWSQLKEIIQAAAKRRGVEAKPPKDNKPIKLEGNKAFIVEPDRPPASAHKIAQVCQQLAYIRDTRGNVEEPLWYAGIGVLRHTVESPAIVHAWSSGHPGYSQAGTDAKIRQHERYGAGPTMCSTFEALHPEICASCPKRGAVRSPIVLGTLDDIKDPSPEDIELAASLQPVEEICIDAIGEHAISTPEHGVEPPWPYERRKDGVYLTFANPLKDAKKSREIVYAMAGMKCPPEIEGVPDQDIRIHKSNLYIDGFYYDQHLGSESFRVCHDTEKNGKICFVVPTTALATTDAIYKSLMANHVKVVPAHIQQVRIYMIRYLEELQKKVAFNELYTSMGWKRDKFILGRHALAPTEKPSVIGLSEGIADGFCQYFHYAGSPETWAELTAVLDQPEMEAHAFGLLCGFGAPLMRFAGFAGALSNAIGKSGAGKTLMASWAVSIYGYFPELIAQKNDTPNSMLQRLGVFANLPFVVDEITNISGGEISDFVYSVTQGRVKTRLRQDASERKNDLRWNTICLSTSNERLYTKLQHAKGAPEAEQLRIFEYDVHRVPVFAEHATDIIRAIKETYGHVGMIYLQKLVEDADNLQERLDAVRQELYIRAGSVDQERFWVAIAACAILGGRIAKELGLIRFDVERIVPWAVAQIKYMRDYMTQHTQDATDVLSAYFNEFAHLRIYAKQLASKGAIQQWSIEHYPTGAIVMRVEDTGAAMRMYVDRRHLYAWLAERHYDTATINRELKHKGLLLNDNRRKVLSGGWTANQSGGQVPTWELDLNHPDMGVQRMRLIEPNQEQGNVVRS